MSEAVRHAEAILRAACGDRVRTGFALAPLTTFRIGGPAALYLEAQGEADLVAAGEAIQASGLPFLVVGKGSNLLVADAGFPGLVLRLGRAYRWAARAGERLRAGAAMPLPALSGVALSHALSGIEFGVAIPGSLGGALRMNAGAHGREMVEIVVAIDAFRLLAGAPATIPADEAGFRYRGTSLPEDAVLLGATLELVPGDREEIRGAMDEARAWRRRTQPLAEPNCGSVFKNPPGDHAARLIDEAGLKGFSIGGARISTKHANFVVADEGATAADVLALVRHVQETVASRSGIRLDPEVHLVGDPDHAAS